jgi:hypothetical protein
MDITNEDQVNSKGKGREPPEKTTNNEEPKAEGSGTHQATADMIGAAIREGIKDALLSIEKLKDGMRTDMAAFLLATSDSKTANKSTIWDVYVNEAKGVDKELVDEWRSSLNFLLVFVSPPSSLIFQN